MGNLNLPETPLLRCLILGFVLLNAPVPSLALSASDGEPVVPPPSPQAIAAEAIQWAKRSDHRMAEALTAIALTQASLDAHETTRDLLSQATAAVDDNYEIYSNVVMMRRLTIAKAQRMIGDLDGMNTTLQDALVAIKRHNREKYERDPHGGDPGRDKVLQLDLEITIAEAHAAVENRDTVATILRRILAEVREREVIRSDFLSRIAILQAKLGHNQQALDTFARAETQDDSYLQQCGDRCFLSNGRIQYLAEFARAQAEAGHKGTACQILKRAMTLALATPVSKIDELGSFPARGDSVKTVALTMVAAVAADIDETGLAIEAQKAMTDEAYSWRTAPNVIRALAKAGQVQAAQELVRRSERWGQFIALGRADKADWTTAVQIDESWKGDRDNCCNTYYGLVDAYYRNLAKARLYVQGVTRALTWARSQKSEDRVYALLGVVDGLSSPNVASHASETGGGSRRCVEY
jgi:tetratricopeptide (TPR) repeat protein